MSPHYLEVLSLNGILSIQDLGRPNSQHLGFSVGGCADESAYLYANKLIADATKKTIGANPRQQLNLPTLELTLGQATFRANTHCVIAITGADCNATINEKNVQNWQCYYLQANDILNLSMPDTGLHTYIAISGGIKASVDQKQWLESYADTFTERSLGFSGQPLTVNSRLYFNVKQQKSPKHQEHKLSTSYNQYRQAQKNSVIIYQQKALLLRFIPSKLFQQLSPKQQQTFIANRYKVSANSNRMGYQLLNSDEIINANNALISALQRKQYTLSTPVTYGSIQFPTSEQPIVLMKERQTMGGYPLLGCVIQTDLYRLSQMRPGKLVHFVPVSLEEAQQNLLAFYQSFEGLNTK